MSNSEIGSIVLALAAIIGLVHILGFCFERMRQPRLVGEIIAGVVLGPFVLGHFLPSASARLFGMAATSSHAWHFAWLHWPGCVGTGGEKAGSHQIHNFTDNNDDAI